MIYNKTSESIKKTIKSSIALMLIPFISSIIIFTILIFTKDSYIKENEETEFNSTVEYIESDFDNVLKLSGKLINSESYRIAYSLEDYRNLKDDEYNTVREYLKLMKDKVSFIDHAI